MEEGEDFNSILKVNFQFIYTRIKDKNGREWFFTPVYGKLDNEWTNVL